MKSTFAGGSTRRAFAFAALATVALWATGCGEKQAVAEMDQTEVLATGTNMVASLQGTLDTGKNHVGDKVALRTTEDLRVNEMTVVPSGSIINGEVTHIDPAGRIAGGAELTLRFTELVMPDGSSYAISAAAGAVVGTGVAIATKGDQIVLPSGQKMRVTLSEPVTIVTKAGAAS